MRASVLALAAALWAAAPGAGRAGDLSGPAPAPAAAPDVAPATAPAASPATTPSTSPAPDGPAPAVVERATQLPEPTMTREAAADMAAKAEADVRAAEKAGLPLSAAIERDRKTAQAELTAHDVKRAAKRWGLALGAGFPDAATASLVFRPLSPVRIHAGPSWNYFGWGLQGGVTFVPWSFVVSPLLSFEAGRFFGSDVSFVAKGENGAAMRPLLDDVSFSYAAADVGLELGNQRGFCFSLRLGLSYVSIATHGTATKSQDGGSVSISNPALNATLPSFKLGFQYWF